MLRAKLTPLLFLLASLPMFAQTDKLELFGGYALERLATGCANYRCPLNSGGNTTNLNGWIASATGYFYKSLGISAQFAGNYNGTAELSGSTVDRYTYEFGPAYAVHFGNASPFAHVLVGGVTQNSSPSPGLQQNQGLAYTRFIWSVGGGLDFKVSSRISIRPVQIDYERQSVPTGEAADALSSVGVNGLRYSAGVVLRF
jgi:hypothetical protein